jgi:Zn-dependent peptidase ImmA (M78 family)/transcriptional regulator with XRE-family HTH domain
MPGRTPIVPAAPEVLRWARQSIDLKESIAAKRLGVNEERLRGWESGETSPTLAQLRKMSDVYRRPLMVLFLDEPPDDFDALRDFRRLPDAEEAVWSPQLHAEFRRALAQREAALELAEDLGYEVPSFPQVSVGTNDDPEDVGARIRSLLGVSVDEQEAWAGERYAALRAWVTAAEDVGTLVMHTNRIELSEMRGFSISEFPLPVIAINGSDATSGRIFTLLHEFAHLLIREAGGLCDLHSAGSRPVDRVEVLCNRLAAATLVPRDALLSDRIVADQESQDDWTDEQIATVARRFAVSQETIVRRLLTFGLVSESFYLAKRDKYEREYAEQRKARSPGGDYVRTRLRDLGRSYVTLVLDAFDQDAITASDVADHLGLKLDHLPRLTEELRRGSSE